MRFTLRQLASSPSFTLVAVTTLALGIGAATAMLSVVNAVLLRPLPYRAPEELAMVWVGTGENARGRPDAKTVDEWRRRSRTFAGMAVTDGATVTLTDRDGADRVTSGRISQNFFPLLGVQPLHGRLFTAEEAEQRARVTLISHRFWQSRYAGSGDAIGATLVLDGQPSQIVGIMPENARLDADVWEPALMSGGAWVVVGRLQPGATVEQAQAEMSGIALALDQDLPAADRNRGVTVIPLSLSVVGARPRLALWMLTGAVLCVLLIAAANVASLSLVRGAGRARELATRAILGASPARIVRQLLGESVALGAISGVLGTLLAAGAIRLIRVLGPADLARLDEAALDLRVLAGTLALSLLTGLLVGLAPAWTLVRRQSHLSRDAGGRGIAGGAAARRIRRGFVVAEVALAIVLLAGAGLLVRSWLSVTRVDHGFTPGRVLVVQVSTTSFGSEGQRTDFYERVLERVAALPGVEQAGVIGDLFVSSDGERLVTTEGPGVSGRVRMRVDEASERFFETMGTPVLQGRAFSREDRPDAPRVAIVNDAMARRVWPGGNPVGERFKLGPRDSSNPWFTVVGVVGDMRRQGPEADPIPQVFEALAQNPPRLGTLHVKATDDEPLSLAAAVRAAVRDVDPLVPVYGVTDVNAQLAAYLTQRRFQTSLLIGFAAVALLMAAIGIYGLMHYLVSMRTQEIGIRMAVGARAADIVRLILREGLQPSLAGLALGLAGALLIGRAASSLLFGVASTDALTFLAVSLLLTAVAAAACYVPARRASSIDPVVALRQG